MVRSFKESFFIALAACLIVQVADSNLQGMPPQQEESKLLQTREFVFFTIDEKNHNLKRHVLTAKSPDLETGVVAFLQHPNVRAELELTRKQETEIDRALATIKHSASDLEKELVAKLFGDGTANDGPGERHEVERLGDQPIKHKLDQIRDKIGHIFDEVLLPHQTRRFDEVCRRFKLRHSGLVNLLLKSELQQELRVSSKQRKQIGFLSQELAIELSELSSDLSERINEELMNVLTNSQSTALRRMIGDPDFGSHVGLDVLVSQLECGKVIQDYTKGIPDELFPEYVIEPVFELDMDGTLRPVIQIGLDNAKITAQKKTSDSN